MARGKTHIRIPSVEGQLGYPPDLVEQYKNGNGNGNGPIAPPAIREEPAPAAEDEEPPSRRSAG